MGRRKHRKANLPECYGKMYEDEPTKLCLSCPQHIFNLCKTIKPDVGWFPAEPSEIKEPKSRW